MRKTRNALVMSMILLVGLGLTGCQRQRAEIKLKKTTKTLAEIRSNYDGDQHSPESMTSIQGKIDQANGLLQTDASQALELATQASSDADRLLEEVKPKEGNDLYSEADRERKIAGVNNLRQEDPERYRRIDEAYEKATAAKTENKWDDVIQQSRLVISEVQAGLASLKNEVDRQQSKAEETLLKLRQMGGTMFAPEVVIQVQDDIKNATKIATEDRDYKLAQVRFTEATTRAEEGIDQVNREKSRRELEKIEGGLTTALVEGALNFKADEYERSFELYEQLLEQYNAGKYTAVLEGVEVLAPRAQRLVFDTKQAASDDHILTMDNNIRQLEQDGILEYIPTALDRLRESLAKAREVRKVEKEESFDAIKQIHVESRDEYERVKGAYQATALDFIRKAKNQLETTRGVYDEMQGIFQPVAAPAEATSDDTAFEAQKQVRQSELGNTLEEAASNLNQSDLRARQDQYKGAIVLAQEVEATALKVLSEVYHTVADNAAIELSRLISRYERDGARQYSPDELARATQALEAVKETIRQGKFKEAVQTAAEARAEVELMAQRITGRANDNLRDAQKALSSAASEKTRKYRAEMLAEVGTLIDQANADLAEDKLKLALEKAQQATALAQQAVKEANLLAAKDKIDEAQGRISQAQEAGAELYAGREVEDARRLVTSSRSLFAAEDYTKAEELALSSAERARRALYKKIDEAEANIATAKSVGGWDHDSSQLAAANTKVREAREALQNNQYDISEKLATEAAVLSASLADSAKDANFHSRIARINANLEEGSKQGINFFQPEDSIGIRRRVAELENMYTRADYERVMTEVEKLEAKLRETLNVTDDMVATVADQQSKRLDDLEEDGATGFAALQVADARSALRYAKLDYRRGMYKSAHSNLAKAITTINDINSRRAQELYSAEVSQLFAEYKAAQLAYSNVLSLDPTELKELAVGANGSAQSVAVSAQITPFQFRSRIDELYSRSLVVKAPPGMERIHEAVVNSFAEGRIAALNFEKLAILNRMAVGTAKDMIDQAYTRMNNSNRLVADVQRQLITDETRFRQLGNKTSAVVNATAK